MIRFKRGLFAQLGSCRRHFIGFEGLKVEHDRDQNASHVNHDIPHSVKKEQASISSHRRPSLRVISVEDVYFPTRDRLFCNIASIGRTVGSSLLRCQTSLYFQVLTSSWKPHTLAWISSFSLVLCSWRNLSKPNLMATSTLIQTGLDLRTSTICDSCSRCILSKRQRYCSHPITLITSFDLFKIQYLSPLVSSPAHSSTNNLYFVRSYCHR